VMGWFGVRVRQRCFPEGLLFNHNTTLAIFALVVMAGEVVGAAPGLDGFFPAGLMRGTTGTVAAIGANEGWPPKVWVSAPGIVFTAQTNKGKFLVAVESNAPPGPCLVRFYNDDGASEPRCLIIDPDVATPETEPNNHFRKPQVVSKPPATIDGRLEKSGDVDSFQIDLQAGQWLEARVESHVLMSKVDPALRLLTTNGFQLAWNHDFVSLDPRLAWRSPSNQTVVLQVFGFAYPPASEIRLSGGDGAVYRLHLKASTQLPLVCASAEDRGKDVQPKDGSVDLPFRASGTISKAMQEDRFPFAAARGDTIAVRVDAASFGSPLDAWVRIEDTRGRELARSDDHSGSPDPQLEWKAPSEGSVVVVIGSVTHRGGDDYCYRLAVDRALPAIDVVLSSSSLVLREASTNVVKFEVKRLRGHTNDTEISIQGLPPCITSTATNLPLKSGTFSLPLTVEENGCRFNGPVHVILKDHVTGEQSRVPFKLTTGGETGYSTLLVNQSDDFWLTLGPKSEKKESTDKK
jgi:hypothetical protein